MNMRVEVFGFLSAMLLVGGLWAGPAEADGAVCPSSGNIPLPRQGTVVGMAELLWTGDGYTAVTYERPVDRAHAQIWVTRFDRAGTPIEGSAVRPLDIEELQEMRDLLGVATGPRGEMGLVYRQSIVDLEEVSTAGKAIPRSEEPTLPTAPSLPGGAAHTAPARKTQAPGTYFVRMSREGRRLARPVRVGGVSGGRAHVAYDPISKSYGIVYQDAVEEQAGDEGVFFRRYSRRGVARGRPVRLDKSGAWVDYARSIAVLPDGGFAVTWAENDGVMLAEVRGQKVRRVTIDERPGSEPAVATDGRHHVVVWRAPDRDGGLRLAWVAARGEVERPGIQAFALDAQYPGNPDVRIEGDDAVVLYVQGGSSPGAGVFGLRARPGTDLPEPALVAPAGIGASMPRFVQNSVCGPQFVYYGFGSPSDAAWRWSRP